MTNYDEPTLRRARSVDGDTRGMMQIRRRLGDVLVESGLLTPQQLEHALEEQRKDTGPRRRLGQVVADLGLAAERDVAKALADLLGLELIDLSRMLPAPDVVRLLPRAVAERTRVLVLDRTSNGLVVAAADPTNVLALDDVKLYTRTPELHVLVATDSQIRDQIARAWAIQHDSSEVSAMVDSVDEDEDEGQVLADIPVGAEDAPIVKLVNQILGDAVHLGASDIHLEVQRDALRVRYRVDGLLRDVMNGPKRIATSVVSRIKVVSGLDIAERRIPQDGRTRFSVGDQDIDARVSTLPSLHGEKVVIRLLTRGDNVPPLDGLGFEPRQLAMFRSALSVPQGLVLITGPTGSGKTNTLYSAIAEIRNPDKNIVTLEDPVEVQLPGITQVGVSEKTGMTFSKGLRSILRQDPDIILVGEVRDSETAELALKAAMTGHLVLTTLHTNSAVAALTRLVDMGVEPFLVASSLTAAIAQRLVRRPCAGCAAPYEPDAVTLAALGLTAADLTGAKPTRGTGCPECGGTGYRGRSAVYEVLDVDAAMRQVLLKDATEASVAAQARAAGMVTLRASAVEKARMGLTTFEEALRVTHSDHASPETCPSCTRSVNRDMVACPWCATALDRGRCLSCSKQLDPDWRICPWCRTPAASSAAAPAPAQVPAGVPVQSMPVQSMPVQSMPVQSMPVQSMPVQSMPVQSMPVQSMPVQAAPAAAPDYAATSYAPTYTGPAYASPAYDAPPAPGYDAPGQATPADPPGLGVPGVPGTDLPLGDAPAPGWEGYDSGWEGYAGGVPTQGA